MPTRHQCSVDTCQRRAEVRGWCSAHYTRWLNDGDVRADVPIRSYRNGTACDVAGCNRLAEVRGWCTAHYLRWLRHGDVRAAQPIMKGPGGNDNDNDNDDQVVSGATDDGNTAVHPDLAEGAQR